MKGLTIPVVSRLLQKSVGCLAVRMLGTRTSSCQVETPATRGGGAGGGSVSCDLEDINIPDLSWSQLCWTNLAQFSRNKALVDGISGRSYSLGEARELAARVGSGLLRSGVQHFLGSFWSFLGTLGFRGPFWEVFWSF